MLGEDPSSVIVDLTLPYCFESSGAFESEFESSDAGERRSDGELSIQSTTCRIPPELMND